MQRARSDAARRLSALLDEIEELSPGLSLADLQAAASRIVSMAPAVQHKSGSKRPRCEQEQSAARVRVGDAVPQADGFQLHLSGRSATGYAGVTDERVKGLTKPYHATAGKYGGKKVHLGYFATPVEAAVAIAKYRQEHPEFRRRRPGPKPHSTAGVLLASSDEPEGIIDVQVSRVESDDDGSSAVEVTAVACDVWTSSVR